MEPTKYKEWQARILDFKKEIEAEIMLLLEENQINGFLRPRNGISVTMKNGDTATVSLIEKKKDLITYYAGPVSYTSKEFTTEGMAEIYKGVASCCKAKPVQP